MDNRPHLCLQGDLYHLLPGRGEVNASGKTLSILPSPEDGLSSRSLNFNEYHYQAVQRQGLD